MSESAVQIYVPDEADLRISIVYRDKPKPAAFAFGHTLGLVSHRADARGRRPELALGYNAFDENESFVRGYN